MIFPACSLKKTEISINIVDNDFGVKGQAVLKHVIRKKQGLSFEKV